MKNTYITIAILAVLLVGAVFIFRGGKTAEAPLSSGQNQSPTPDAQAPSSPEVFCTMEARSCPDGSSVGRVGPKCEFEACPGAKNAPVKEFTVTGQNFSFGPALMTVKEGDKVKITFKDITGNHDFKIDEFNVATSVLEAGDIETVEFIANKIGSFEYYCSVGTHRAMGMKGVLKVEKSFDTLK